MIVDIDDENLHWIPDAANRIDVGHVPVGQFADVAEAILSWEDFDERAEVTNAGNDTVVDLADLYRCCACFHAAESCAGCIGIGASYGYIAFVIHIDRRTGVLLDRTDVLSTWADEQPDLVRIDFGTEQSRSVAADLAARARNAGEHLTQDLHPCFASLFKRCANDFFADPVDLEIELDPGDSVLGTGDLEVHIAVMVFVTEDVGEEDKAIFFIANQSDADTSNRVGDRNASSHQSQAATANAGHRGGAIALEDVADQADGVREIIWVWENGFERSLGEHSVSDFTASRPAVRFALTDGEWREVVVEHELFAVLIHQAIDPLLVSVGTECHGDEGLGLTPLEQGCSVGTWEQVGFAVNVSKAGCVSTVAARSRHDQVANNPILKCVPCATEYVRTESTFSR